MMHSDTRPTFRFRGHVDPRTLPQRQPLRAAVSGTVGEQVATIRIYDPIDSWGGEWGVSAKEFAALLDEMPTGVSEIRLHINSPGGEVFEGVTIRSLLAEHPARVVAVVDGVAASIASTIAVAADELVMAAGSSLMIHDAWGVCVGNAAAMTHLAGTLDKLSGQIAATYAAKGGTDTDWRALMRDETWFTAEEALAAGLADSVIGGDDEPAEPAEKVDGEQPEAGFDLSQFRYAGRDEAPAPALANTDQPDAAAPVYPDPSALAHINEAGEGIHA